MTPRLTAAERDEALQRADRVRSIITWMSLAAPVICVALVFIQHTSAQNNLTHIAREKFPSLYVSAQHGVGPYISILVGVFGFLWSPVRVPLPEPTVQGMRIARLRDNATLAVFFLLTLVPILVYSVSDIPEANTVMVSYQNVLQAFAAGGLGFYFGIRHERDAAAEVTSGATVNQPDNEESPAALAPTGSNE